MSPGETTGGRAATSFVGDILPGGRKGFLDGESGREAEGVFGRDSLMLKAGRKGGAISAVPSLSRLALLCVGEGQGDIRDRVSMVRSDKEGRGFRLSLAGSLEGRSTPRLGFSLPSSNTGESVEPGGVVCIAAIDVPRRASLTGETLLGLAELSVQAYRERIDWLMFSPRGPWRPDGRGRWEFFRKSSLWIVSAVEDLAESFRLSLEGSARGIGRRERRGMLPRSGTLDPCSWSMLRISVTRREVDCLPHGFVNNWKSKEPKAGDIPAIIVPGFRRVKSKVRAQFELRRRRVLTPG